MSWKCIYSSLTHCYKLWMSKRLQTGKLKSYNINITFILALIMLNKKWNYIFTRSGTLNPLLCVFVREKKICHHVWTIRNSPIHSHNQFTPKYILHLILQYDFFFFFVTQIQTWRRYSYIQMHFADSPNINTSHFLIWLTWIRCYFYWYYPYKSIQYRENWVEISMQCRHIDDFSQITRCTTLLLRRERKKRMGRGKGEKRQ